MSDINQNSIWSQVDGSNNQTPPTGWPEGQMPSTVNDCARARMGAIKRWYDRIGPTVVSTGSANAQVLGYTVAPTALVRGDTFSFLPGFTNTGPATITITGSGSPAIPVLANGTALVGNEIVLNVPCMVQYDGTSFHIVGGIPRSVLAGYLPLTGGSLSGNLFVQGGVDV